MDIIVKMVDLLTHGRSDEQIKGFLEYYSSKLWNEYERYQMDQRVIIENKVRALLLNLPNASVNKAYSVKLSIADPELTDITMSLSEPDLGLKVEKLADGRSFNISGTPSRSGSFKLQLSCRSRHLHYADPFVRQLSLIINPDPWDLWVEKPVSPGIEYPKDDTSFRLLRVPALPDGSEAKIIAAASRRGRSHAQDGRPRDDDFAIFYDERSGWYVLAVADGAGSAPYARAGSEIACNNAVAYCRVQLAQAQQLEADISKFMQSGLADVAVKTQIQTSLYKILGHAAWQACRSVQEESRNKGRRMRDYATTLLLTICRKCAGGWFIASFWVGDGAVAVYRDRADEPARLLCEPDEGEYAGQTRFLLPDIFSGPTETAVYENLCRRIKYAFVPDFTALFMMTDGVSDPKFGSDANLHSFSRWEDLWAELRENGVDFSHNNDKTDAQLLEWLNFRSVGNHDDRTIVVLY